MRKFRNIVMMFALILAVALGLTLGESPPIIGYRSTIQWGLDRIDKFVYTYHT